MFLISVILSTAQALLGIGSTQADLQEQFAIAATRGDTQKIISLLAEGASPNFIYPGRTTVVMKRQMR